MPSETIDFDERNSDLQIGIEVEYPVARSESDYLVGRGRESNHIQRDIDHWPSTLDSRPVYDGTVGLEVVSDVLDLADARNWYESVIEYVESEYGAKYQPTGLMAGGSTAGTHIHISSISERKARELADLSSEPWMQVLFCSSIATDRDGGVAWPVFRGGRYCDLSFGSRHYNVVNGRGRGHYEWRLVEPMIPEHIEILTTFLRIFEQDTDEAVTYAQELLDDVDDRITSIKRAEKIGLDMDAVPAVTREPSLEDPENFYEEISDSWHHPQIYTVQYGDQEYYTFDSRLDGTVNAAGIEFNTNDVLYANTLEAVTNDELANDVQRALNRRGEPNRETEATGELKKVLKKKKK